MTLILLLVDHDQRVAVVDDIALRDHHLGDGAGHLGEHRDLHLHRFQDHDGIVRGNPRADLDLDGHHRRDEFGDNGVAHVAMVWVGAVDRLTHVNASGGKTSPKSAPKPASWSYAEDYVPESEAARAAREEAARFGVSPLGRGGASALTLLARAVQAKAVVEIGTGSGVSGLALFAGMQPDGVLTSVDIEPEHQHAARNAFLAVGIPTQRFRLISGAALSVLPRLSDGAYDLVFVDADKAEYPEYVEQGLRLLRHGGVAGRRQRSMARPDGRPAQDDEQTEAIRSAITAVRRTTNWSRHCCPSATDCWSR